MLQMSVRTFCDRARLSATSSANLLGWRIYLGYLNLFDPLKFLFVLCNDFTLVFVQLLYLVHDFGQFVGCWVLFSCSKRSAWFIMAINILFMIAVFNFIIFSLRPVNFLVWCLFLRYLIRYYLCGIVRWVLIGRKWFLSFLIHQNWRNFLLSRYLAKN